MKYQTLQPLTGVSVLRGHPCKDEFDKYVKCVGFYTEVSDVKFKEICNNPVWRDWLIDHRYIERVQEQRYEMGKITINGRPLLIARLNCDKSSDKRYVFALLAEYNGNDWAGVHVYRKYNDAEITSLTFAELSTMFTNTITEINGVVVK